MKKVIAILALAAAPVVFAQEKPASLQAKKSQEVEATEKKAEQAKKQEEVKAKKISEAEALEAKKVENKASANRGKAAVSLKEESSRAKK